MDAERNEEAARITRQPILAGETPIIMGRRQHGITEYGRTADQREEAADRREGQ